jgi:membrane fusion protein, multidrug efflux system
MKKVLLIITVVSIFTACSNNGNQVDGDLALLMAERDAAKAKKDSISEVIVGLETKIAALDTTQKLSLVTLAEFQPKKFEHFVKVHGVVKTDDMAMINAESQGKIESISINEGQKVTKGQVLATVNGDVIRRSIAELENRLELAQTIFERQEKLWKQNIGSEIQYLQAKNERDALQKSLQTTQEQLSMTVIKAPFTGVIDEIFPKEGEYTSPGAPFFRLINLDNVYIKADVSETYISSIGVGDSVDVIMPNSEVAVIRTSISRVGNFINPDNRTFKIRLDVPNKNYLLKPNMLAEINIRDYNNDSTLVIPENLILQGAQSKLYVFTAEMQGDGIARVTKKVLKTGLTYNNEVEILSGLAPGAKIVDKGARGIQEGELVEVISNNQL